MKNKGGLIIFSAGVIIGSALEYLCTRKQVKALRDASDKNYDRYQKELEKANNYVDEVNQLRQDLTTCRITNWQTATYATRLKQQLDQFME
jgi:hypothetical protein